MEGLVKMCEMFLTFFGYQITISCDMMLIIMNLKKSKKEVFRDCCTFIFMIADSCMAPLIN